MKIFQKRETLVQNIAFLAIMAAINIVLLLLTNILPYLLLLLTLILPFVSLLVTMLCKKRYYPIYVVVTIGLSFLVSIDAINNTLFYILPGVLSGFIFGYCLEKQIPSNYSILYSAFVYVVCSYLSVFICSTVLGVPIEDLYFSILNLDQFFHKEYLIAPFIFSVGIIQSSLSYLVIQNEIKKLGIIEKEIDSNFEIIYLFVFILLTLLSLAIQPTIYIMFLGFTIYEFLHVEKLLFRDSKKLFFISLGITVLVSIFAFAILYQVILKVFLLSIFLIPLFIVGIIVLINNCLIKRKNSI